jgi:hypothetical protein
MGSQALCGIPTRKEEPYDVKTSHGYEVVPDPRSPTSVDWPSPITVNTVRLPCR